MSHVIGMDTKSTGLHWVSNFGIGIDSDRGETYGWIECDARNEDERRNRLIDYTVGLFRAIRSDTIQIGKDREIHVFCEEPLALQNGKTTRLLGLAAGAIYGAFVLSGANAWWHWVDQSSWKKSVLGRGVRPRDYTSDAPKAKWEKEWIRETVLLSPGFMVDANPVLVGDFDEHRDLYDAWAIKTYGVRILAN